MRDPLPVAATRAYLDVEGERRVVTMLFCDVHNSTATAEKLDPEEWTEIINGAFEYMIRPIYKFEGTVARLMGDAILAFFGAPISHEDDPQRVVFWQAWILSTVSRPIAKKSSGAGASTSTCGWASTQGWWW